MSTTTISQLVSLLKSRERLVNGQYALVEEQQKEGMTELGTDEEDQNRVTVGKCYSNIKCSSNDSTLSRWVWLWVCLMGVVTSDGCGGLVL